MKKSLQPFDKEVDSHLYEVRSLSSKSVIDLLELAPYKQTPVAEVSMGQSLYLSR